MAGFLWRALVGFLLIRAEPGRVAAQNVSMNTGDGVENNSAYLPPCLDGVPESKVRHNSCLSHSPNETQVRKWRRRKYAEIWDGPIYIA